MNERMLRARTTSLRITKALFDSKPIKNRIISLSFTPKWKTIYFPLVTIVSYGGYHMCGSAYYHFHSNQPSQMSLCYPNHKIIAPPFLSLPLVVFSLFFQHFGSLSCYDIFLRVLYYKTFYSYSSYSDMVSYCACH
jgi:hypothetical protein